MWIRNLTLIMLASVALAQLESLDGPVSPRKIRLRRPRPIGISNVEGIAQGRPVPLQRQPAQSTADLLAATLEREAQGNDALQSLLATAAQDIEVEEEEEIVEEAPLAAARPAGRRRVPGVPRRRRPQGEPAAPLPSGPAGPLRSEDGEGRASNGRPREEPVKTTERYSHMNEDGSFTFGYVAEDGSFREETRGVDCITRGKYGYIDPDGKRREFTYVSGLPCDTNEEEDGFEDDNDIVREDPIAPSDRFRTSQAVQLTEDEIPIAARQRVRARPVARPLDAARRPESATAAPRQPPRRRPTRPSGAVGSTALQNLLSIAGAEQAAAAPTASRPRQRPRPTTPRPSVDFDREVDSFTLGRPSITFDDQEEARKQAGAPAPNFSTDLVFDPTSGTFKTELRQAIQGDEKEIRITNDAAPARGAAPTTPSPTTPRPATPTPAAFSPTPRPTAAARPFTAFASTTRRPQPAAPTAFTPLSFPSPTTPRRPAPTTPAASPSPIPVTTPRPVTPSPSPAGSFFFQPFQVVGQPRPVAPGQPATPRPVAPQTVQLPAGTFTLGQPPQQPRLPQPPAIPGFPRPTPVAQQAARPVTPPQAPSRPATPPPSRPVPTPPPTRPVPTPQVQFGFRPVPQQQQQQGRPFTAFAQGPPPQLQSRPQPSSFQPRPPQTFQSRPQPQTFQTRPQPQQFRSGPPPQQPQQFRSGPPPQQPQQFRSGPPPQQQPSRFSPFGRPQPGPPASSPFTVFNPSALRGA